MIGIASFALVVGWHSAGYANRRAQLGAGVAGGTTLWLIGWAMGVTADALLVVVPSLLAAYGSRLVWMASIERGIAP
jgi:hypothetical protein